jgi:hypothetical protein
MPLLVADQQHFGFMERLLVRRPTAAKVTNFLPLLVA